MRKTSKVFSRSVRILACCLSVAAVGHADSQSYKEYPGLRQADGSPHDIRPLPGLTGRLLNATSCLKAAGGSLADDPARDDRPALEAALQDARPGDEMYLPDGVYNLNSSWSTNPRANLALPAGVSIRGQSRSGTILKSSFNDTGKDNHSVVLIEGASNLVVSNLTITSSWNRTYSDSTKQNNPEEGGPSYAVAVGGGKKNGNASCNIIIDNIVVEKYRRMGVRLGAGTHDVIIRNCHAQNATDLGAGGSGYGFFIAGPGHLNVTTNPWLGTPRDTYWNTIDSCTTGPHIRHAVVIQYWSHNNLVTRCRFTSAIDAIDLHGEDEYNNEVAYNEVYNVAGQSAVGIGNNGAMHDKSGPGNWVHHNKFTGCKFGVTVEYGSEFQRIENNVIQGNTMYPDGRGIGLGNTKHTLVRNNVISGNTAPAYAAISLFPNRAEGEEPAGSPVDCTVTNNVFTGNTHGVVWAPSLPVNARLVNTIQKNSSVDTIDHLP